MKKILILLLACLTLFLMTACGTDTSSDPPPVENTENVQTEDVENVPDNTAEEDPAPQVPIIAGGTPLTQEQIDRANEAFEPIVVTSDNISTSSLISCFFTSYYDTPAELNFKEFLRYYPGNQFVPDNTDELRALIQQIRYPDELTEADYFLPTPTHRYPTDMINDTLKTYMDITIDDLESTGDVPYMEAYDSYYNFTSDFGPGLFRCVGGTKVDDTVYLWSRVYDSNQGFVNSIYSSQDRPENVPPGCQLLTLKQVGENYYIQSFQRVAVETTID